MEKAKRKGIYYIYAHIDPFTKEVIYIGRGTYERAWTYKWNASRDKEHRLYLEDLTKRGFIATEWVKILLRQLTRAEAVKAERIFITEYLPKYNKDKGAGSRTDKRLIHWSRALRKQGLSYTEIMKRMKLKSPMSAWRYVNAEYINE